MIKQAQYRSCTLCAQAFLHLYPAPCTITITLQTPSPFRALLFDQPLCYDGALFSTTLPILQSSKTSITLHAAQSQDCRLLVLQGCLQGDITIEQ